MKPQHWIAPLVALALALQGATFAYVLKVEGRLSRLEAMAELGALARRPGSLGPTMPARGDLSPKLAPPPGG